MRLAMVGVIAVALAVTWISGCTGPKAGKTAPPELAAKTAATNEAPAAPGAQAKAQSKLTVMVPCGMLIPIHAVIEEFRKANPDIEVLWPNDNPLVLVKKITERNEPCDVFISPGQVEIGMLEKAGRADPTAKVPIGTFELVVITQAGNPLEIHKPEDLKKCKTISTPSPATNSVGYAGKEALTKLGLWDALEPKMVKFDHAIESHKLVASGKADAGIAYRNCPLDTNPEKVAKSKIAMAFAFDTKLYPPQKCYVAALKTAANPQAAQKFVEFIASEAMRKLMADKGMAGCMDDLGCPIPGAAAGGAAHPSKAAAASSAAPIVQVRAYYPAPGHEHIKKLVEALPQKYRGKVASEFIDWSTDEGMKRLQEAGLTCGTILINGQESWTYEKGGKLHEVSFVRGMGIEWTEDDLYAVIEKIIKEKEAGK